MSKKSKLAFGIAGAAVLLVGIHYLYRSRTPSGQQPLTMLREDNFNQFHSAFNRRCDGARLLLLVSPT
jgi:hypothetical protein